MPSILTTDNLKMTENKIKKDLSFPEDNFHS